MLRMLGTVNRWVGRLLEWAVTIFMLLLVVTVTWQVLSRYVTRNPSRWPEELALVLLMWVALLGGTIAFMRKAHLGVDYFVEKLRGRRRVAVELFIQAWIVLFAGVLTYGGSAVVLVTAINGQQLPALGVERAWVYLAVPLAGVLILLHSIEAMWASLRALKDSSYERKAI